MGRKKKAETAENAKASKRRYDERRSKAKREAKERESRPRRKWLKPGSKKLIIDFEATMKTLVQAAYQRGIKSGYGRGFKRAEGIGKLDVQVLKIQEEIRELQEEEKLTRLNHTFEDCLPIQDQICDLYRRKVRQENRRYCMYGDHRDHYQQEQQDLRSLVVTTEFHEQIRKIKDKLEL